MLKMRLNVRQEINTYSREDEKRMQLIKRKLTPFKIYFLFLMVATLAGCSTTPRFPIKLDEPNISHAQIQRGVLHVHTRYSHDSSGSVKSIIKTARKHNLDFVVITDHNNMAVRADATYKTHSEKPLLLIGHAISSASGHVIALGVENTIPTPVEAQQAIDQIHARGGYAFLAHPVCEKSAWQDWSVDGFDGIEIYNHVCDFYDTHKFNFLIKSIILSPSLFAQQIMNEPRELIVKWDSLLGERPVSGVGAIDAHVQYRFLGFPSVRYSLSFRMATLHVLSADATEAAILKSIANGKNYTVFEALGFTNQFQYVAIVDDDIYHIGDHIRRKKTVEIRIFEPDATEIKLIHNGTVIMNVHGHELLKKVKDPGYYRVEVYRNGKLWIITNPIRLEG